MEETVILDEGTAASMVATLPVPVPKLVDDILDTRLTLIDTYQELFLDVQTSRVFSDSKIFVDCVPLARPAQIVERYRNEKSTPGFSLPDFVKRNFSIPSSVHPEDAVFLSSSLDEHVRALWPKLTRKATDRGHLAIMHSTLLALPHDYVVPGGRFNEIYYWDSYFTMLGLIEDGHHRIAESMVLNFAALIDQHGHVPNGNRSYYLSRSQPPFFFKMVESLSPTDPAALHARFLPQLKAEHEYWMAGAEGLGRGQAHARVVHLPDGSMLNRFWDDRDDPREESFHEDVATAQDSGRDPRRVYRDLRAAAESGWDFSSRWCADPTRLSTIETTALLPVDLNGLLHGLERAIAAGCAHLGDMCGARHFEALARRRRESIDKHLWCDALGHYVDFHWVSRTQRPNLTAATAMPLFVGLASPAQAASVAEVLQARLLFQSGLVTTDVPTGQQWDFPNGWAPLQWIAVEGLRRYGHHALARTISDKWLACVEKVYRDTGRLVEKYNVIEDKPGGGGEYTGQCGFGWTNGVYVKLRALQW